MIPKYRGFLQKSGLSARISPSGDRAARWDPVLIYQMSKVGSTSLHRSLQFAYFNAGASRTPIHHAHTLTNLDLHEQLVTQAGALPHQLSLVQEYKKIREGFESDPQQRWKVVSLVRDPVARQISDFFHHLDRHLPQWQTRWRGGDLGIEAIMQNFLTVHDPTLNWFEAEIDAVLGIDVYAKPFPHETGFAIYRHPPKVDLMVIRLEDLDHVASRAVEEFFGIKQFRLYSFNLASETRYGEVYRQFKKQPIPEWYLQNVYSSRMARHFYSEAELADFQRKWSRQA